MRRWKETGNVPRDAWPVLWALHKAMAGAALCSLIGTAAVAETISSASIYVIDGDTIDVDGNRFRLVGLDTPETYRAQCDYDLALGGAATARLVELVGSGSVLDLAVLPGRDKYGRGLARFFVGGRNVAEILTSDGLARAYEGGRRLNCC